MLLLFIIIVLLKNIFGLLPFLVFNDSASELWLSGMWKWMENKLKKLCLRTLFSTSICLVYVLRCFSLFIQQFRMFSCRFMISMFNVLDACPTLKFVSLSNFTLLWVLFHIVLKMGKCLPFWHGEQRTCRRKVKFSVDGWLNY